MSRVGERDERLRSPDFQASAIRVKAQAAGVEVEMCEPELDVSGSKRNRAVLDAIVARIERGELAGIIVYNLSRLSRLKPRDRIELVERIEAAGGTILSASESFDAATPEGRFQRDLFFSIARMQWEQAAEGFAVAKENAIAEGRPIKARIPFGYRQASRGAALEVVADEAEVVFELYRMRAAGASYADCLVHFEQATGRSSYGSTMRAILSNRTYLGELRYGREVELVKAGAHEAIIDLERFELVQAINQVRGGDRGARGSGTARSMLASIARCESCGRGLIRSRTGSALTLSYKCPGDNRHCAARAFIGAAELEAFVVERVLAWAGPIADEPVELEADPLMPGTRDAAAARLTTAERRLREWAEDLELEDRDEAAYRAGLEARRARVELRRQELEAHGAASMLETARASLREALTSDVVDDEEKRQLLGIVLAGVIVRRTPRRGAPVVERARVLFADAPADTGTEQSEPELVEQLPS